MIEIKRIFSDPSSRSFLDTLKQTIFGKFYLRYLRQYQPIRFVVIGVWKTLFPVFQFIYYKIRFYNSQAYNFIRLDQADKASRLLYPSQKVIVGVPDVYPVDKSSIVKIPATYDFPEVFIASLTDATVTGGSGFVYTNQSIVGHNLFRISHDYTSEELHGRIYVNSKRHLISVLSGVDAVPEIDQGVLFTDAVSLNYAHFMTELLPRVFAYTQSNPNQTAPLIVDSEIHSNLMSALEIVVGDNVKLVVMDKGAKLRVKFLQVVSSCGYVPFERRPRTNKFTDHSHGNFSPTALLGMRELIKSKLSNMPLSSITKHNYKKIWIKRNSTYRNVSNASEIELALVERGFTVIEPEKLSFIEQVLIFSNADIIVGATGAAFANLIFCKSETKIVILIAEFKYMIYGYWQSMAASVGNHVSYVLGSQEGKMSNLHGNFRVDIQSLLKAISN